MTGGGRAVPRRQTWSMRLGSDLVIEVRDPALIPIAIQFLRTLARPERRTRDRGRLGAFPARGCRAAAAMWGEEAFYAALRPEGRA